ncbi:MAG: class I SAM-dependent methyltransferase [Propionibacteriaceae bacterium]|nr:class I SAM-dependent methyltransferase [Propionibacteriaceae bacterium]
MLTFDQRVEHLRQNAVNAAARSDVIAAAVAQSVPESNTLSVLDYGCGPGHIGVRLAGHFAHVVLADVDAQAVDQACAASSDLANTSVRWLDLTDVVPSDLHVDVVVSSLSWHHIPDLGSLLEALPQVADGGRLFVIDMDDDGGAYHADHPEYAGITGFDRDALAGLLRGHGYVNVTITDLWKGEKWVADKLVPMSLFLIQARIPSDID